MTTDDANANANANADPVKPYADGILRHTRGKPAETVAMLYRSDCLAPRTALGPPLRSD